MQDKIFNHPTNNDYLTTGEVRAEFIRIFNILPSKLILINVHFQLIENFLVKLGFNLVSHTRNPNNYSAQHQRGAVFLSNNEAKIFVMLENWSGEFSKVILKNGIEIGDGFAAVATIYYDEQAKEETLFQDLEGFSIKIIVPKSHAKFVSFLCKDSQNGYMTRSFDIKQENFDLSRNYNDDFGPINDKIKGFLESSTSGLVLLHGEPGTGKTSYIRHLLSTISKETIYVTPDMIRAINDPIFLTFWLKKEDFVLVIEDAEDLVIAREDNGNMAGVSNLLNLTDGILGGCLKTKIICTFNTQVENVDPALLRKGRLFTNYEFKKLSVQKANDLLKHLGIQETVNEPTTLGDIYNIQKDTNYKSKDRAAIGFAK